MYAHEEYCALAGEEIRRFAALIRKADPTVRVSTCGRWKLADLVHHTGAIHRWAAGLVRDRAQKYRRISDTDDWVAGAGPDTQADWIGAALSSLVETLRGAEPDEKMYAWGADQHVRFWSRRMTHETGIHRADALLALGEEPAFEPAIAADGVSEFLANVWKARAWRWNIGKLRGENEMIRLAATDTRDEWTITMAAKRFEWSQRQRGQRPAPPAANVTVRSTASDLYLMMWGRYRCSDPRFEVRGDAELLAHWQTNSAV